jgi:hypothetical protein
MFYGSGLTISITLVQAIVESKYEYVLVIYTHVGAKHQIWPVTQTILVTT